MASSVHTQEICGMCGDGITKNAKGSLYKAGAETIFKISENLKDGLAEKLKSMPFPIPIHASCRKEYTKPSVIKGKKRKMTKNQDTCFDERVSRSKVKKYNPYTDCCLCNEVIPYFKNCTKDDPENYNTKVETDKRDHCAETEELTQTTMRKAKERNDVWGKEVEYRLGPFVENSDLVALEAKLHNECQVCYQRYI